MFKTTKAKVIFVSFFCIICVIITLGLILYKNIEIEESWNENSTNVEKEQTEIKDVAGIDLKGTYNQNDLKIEEKRVTLEKAEIQYCQIDGLKNKEIQENINNELREIALNSYKKEIKNLDEVINVSVTMWNTANFGNVLSFESYYVAKKDDNGDGLYKGHRCLNYNLITGEKITIENLFTSDAPMKNILRKSAYYSLVKNCSFEDNLSGDLVVSDYGDIEYDVVQFINLYNNGSITEFYFTPSNIYMYYKDDIIVSINMKDYFDYIAIYNRYVSQESIFEVDNIGLNNLYTLTNRDAGAWYYTNYQKENNYLIDITIGYYGKDEFGKQLIQDKIIEIETEIEKVKSQASKKLNEFYILNYHIDVTTDEELAIAQNLTCYTEKGNYYEMTVHDFEESIEPLIIEYCQAGEETLLEYVYDFSNVLKVKPQETKEYYNNETGEKIVI